MPSAEYSHLGDDDLGALIAYLKSVPPVDRDRVPLEVGPVARVLMLAGKLKLAAQEIDHANLQPASVQPGATVEYGRYLAVGCTGCHGPNFSGGKIDIGPPDWPHAANLTPHADGRLAKWTEDDFLKVLRTARRPDGSEVNPVMPRNFGQMDDMELKAIWLYLRTLPPVPTGSR
jgi:mono/diheme cytochrome c family protein